MKSELQYIAEELSKLKTNRYPRDSIFTQEEFQAIIDKAVERMDKEGVLLEEDAILYPENFRSL